MEYRLTHLRDWFESPGLTSRNDRRIAASLQAIGLIFLVTALAITVATFQSSNGSPSSTTRIALATSAIVALGSLLLVRRGQLRASAWLLVGITWVGTTIGVLGSGGIRLPGVAFYAISIVAAGLLLSSRAAVVAAILSILATGVTVLLEEQGLLPIYSDKPISLFGVYSVLFVAITGLVFISINRIHEAFDDAEHSEDELARRNQDLTETLAHKERAEHSEALLQEAMEQAGEAIAILSAEGLIQYANAEFASVSERTLAELEGLLMTQVFPPTDRETSRDIESRLIAGEKWRGRFSVASGSVERLLDGSLSPVHDDKGRLIHIVGVFRDITHEVQLEAHLRQSQKMHALGQLAGGVAHDFNNLLVVIQGCADLLRGRSPKDPDEEDSLAQIREAVNQAAGLTAQLLAFGRRQVQNNRTVSLSEIAREAEAMLRRLVPESITIDMVLASEGVNVHVDSNQIHQVLLNLAANARDAMPEGGNLRIETRRLPPNSEAEDAESWVELRVSDTGTGMDTKTLEQIFDPFFTTKDINKGTGLGLASVYGIIDQSGGSIEVESLPGTGTTFRIQLPGTAQAPHSSTSPSTKLEPRKRNERILLVEDQDAVRKMLYRLLERAGYSVTVAHDGVDALEKIEDEEQPIEILLTDVTMPRLGGLALAARVRERWPKVKVVFTSGYAPNDRLQDPDPLESSCFLPKPFSVEELYAALDDLAREDHG